MRRFFCHPNEMSIAYSGEEALLSPAVGAGKEESKVKKD